MSLTQRTDYVEQAHARLPRFFRDKPRLFAIIAAAAEGAQDFEAHAFSMYLPRFLENAAGATLDVYGAIVGQERGGMDDASYRLRIRARMALNRSSGTIPDLIRIAQLLVPDNTVLLRESFPAAILMQIAGGATPLSEDVYQVLYAAKAGGVSFRLTTQDGADAQRFVFSGGVGLGFGGVATDWVGPVVQTQKGLGPSTLGAVTTLANTSGSGTPVFSIYDATLVPADIGSVTVTVDFGQSSFSWTSPTGAGFGGQTLHDEEGNPASPATLIDENGVYGAEVGISVLFADDTYNPGDSWRVTVVPPQPIDSTAPVVTATGPLTAAATGRWTFTVTTAAPGFWFSYKRPDGTTSSARAMNRGTPIVLRDASLNPVGLSVTWPNVSTYYVNAKHTVRAHRGSTVTGGHWVDVR